MPAPNKKAEVYHAPQVFEQFAKLVTAEEFAERLAQTFLNSKPGSREQSQSVQQVVRLLNRHEDKNPDVTDEDLRDMSDEELQAQVASLLGANDKPDEQPVHTPAAD